MELLSLFGVRAPPKLEKKPTSGPGRDSPEDAHLSKGGGQHHRRVSFHSCILAVLPPFSGETVERNVS